MPRIDILRESNIQRTARVVQVESLFDVAPSDRSGERWSLDVDIPAQWNIGVIVGPSGSGKSTVARELFAEHVVKDFSWPDDKCVLDGFRKDLSVKDVTGVLSSVGFSSPPSWLRPFHVLSTGQQFRVHVARSLLESPEPCVIDEFTSVVDRTVAQIGSAAIARTVRQRSGRFVAVTCHYDVIDWLDPDWVLEMPQGLMTRRLLQRRPPIEIEVIQVNSSAWELFKPHHYLSADLNKAARCFLALANDKPAAFNATLAFPHATNPAWRSHRTVCLPDYQGVGIGSALQEFVASIYSATGRPFRTSTSHPSLIRSRAKSINWKMIKSPDINTLSRNAKARAASLNKTVASNRLTATFEYVGPRDPENARKFGLLP